MGTLFTPLLSTFLYGDLGAPFTVATDRCSLRGQSFTEDFYQLLSDQQVTVLNQTPSAFRQLTTPKHLNGLNHLALRLVILAARPWNHRRSDRGLSATGRWSQLINMYGITETTVHVTYHQ